MWIRTELVSSKSMQAPASHIAKTGNTGQLQQHEISIIYIYMYYYSKTKNFINL